jgi:hypothetical protein
VIIDDLDVVGIALAKFEADTPALVDRHRPLSPPVTFELVKADASQRTQIVERFGDVQRQQKINGGFEIQAAELVWPLAVSDLAGRRISPRPDHGINILRQTVNAKSTGELEAGVRRGTNGWPGLDVAE